MITKFFIFKIFYFKIHIKALFTLKIDPSGLPSATIVALASPSILSRKPSLYVEVLHYTINDFIAFKKYF